MSWIVSGIALVLAIGVPIYGRISDFFELRKLYIFAIMILASGSLLCAIAPNLPLLVLGRMVQGAGMSAIPVLSVIAISKVSHKENVGSFGNYRRKYWCWNCCWSNIWWSSWSIFRVECLVLVHILLAIMIVIGAYYALPTIKPAESVGSNKNLISLVVYSSASQ
ncbi:MFS family major facilitator transporter, tetracycline:cation symporter TetL [Enterococcus faecium]|nr:MFS family major facilitator transporter, tetracycline:cation symporter TetL [Enterococcus faecium]